MRALLLPLVPVLVLALAGCIAPAPGPGAPPGSAAALPAAWYAKALARGADHNHTVVEQHMGASTPNFRLLGHDPLPTEHYGGRPAYNYGCGGIATTPAGRRLDVIDAWQNDLSFVLEDVTDPAHPAKVGEFYAQGMRTYDADLTPDGRFVVLAFDAPARAPAPVPGPALAPVPGPALAPVPGLSTPPALRFRGACAGSDATLALPDAVAASQGIVLVDVRDPAHPQFADWDPTPGANLHSVSTALVDNVTWVAGSVLGGAHPASYFVFDQVQDTPLGPKLVRQGVFDSPPVVMQDGMPASVPLRNGHTDVAMAKHPKDGKLYAYAADWNGGVLIIDLSEPRLPVLVAQWAPPQAAVVQPTGDGPCYPGAIHDVLPVPVLWEGKAYLFAGQECPKKVDVRAPGGSVFILDATDASKLRLAGSWHLPEDTGVWTMAYQASPHYLALVQRTLFVSDYHAGIWAVDVGGNLSAPPSIGVYVPAIPPAVPPSRGEASFDAIPFDEQVDAYPDGTLVANDDTTGLYVLRFDAQDPAPPAPPFPYPSR